MWVKYPRGQEKIHDQFFDIGKTLNQRKELNYKVATKTNWHSVPISSFLDF